MKRLRWSGVLPLGLGAVHSSSRLRCWSASQAVLQRLKPKSCPPNRCNRRSLMSGRHDCKQGKALSSQVESGAQ